MNLFYHGLAANVDVDAALGGLAAQSATVEGVPCTIGIGDIHVSRGRDSSLHRRTAEVQAEGSDRRLRVVGVACRDTAASVGIVLCELGCRLVAHIVLGRLTCPGNERTGRSDICRSKGTGCRRRCKFLEGEVIKHKIRTLQTLEGNIPGVCRTVQLEICCKSTHYLEIGQKNVEKSAKNIKKLTFPSLKKLAFPMKKVGEKFA